MEVPEPFAFCVKCGAEKEDGLECPKCGVVYAKAEAAQRKKTEAALGSSSPIPPESSPGFFKEFKNKNKFIFWLLIVATPLIIYLIYSGSQPYKSNTPSYRSAGPANETNLEKLERLDREQVARELKAKQESEARVAKPRPQQRQVVPIERSSPPPVPRHDIAETFVLVLNNMYGNVCHAELTGFWSKTLKIEWTSNTVKIQAIKVLAEVGSAKEQLYLSGVRYFQFPNDMGTFNVIDWETGEKKSISDQAQYYFR